MVIRLLISIPIWIIFFTIRLALIILGYPMIALAAACGAYHWQFDKKKEDKGENPWVAHFTWPFMWLWDNPEDGIANDMYFKAPNKFLQILYWSAYRNPVNNLRQAPIWSFKIDPKKVRWVGTNKPVTQFDKRNPEEEWFFAWHGLLYSCLWIQFKLQGKIWRFWIGHKLFPLDTIQATGHRAQFGASFTTQLKNLQND